MKTDMTKPLKDELPPPPDGIQPCGAGAPSMADLRARFPAPLRCYRLDKPNDPIAAVHLLDGRLDQLERRIGPPA